MLIISDDQAYGDFGFMGSPHVRTPHLDRLAAEGTVFTQGYAASSLCAPSLQTLLTGLHPFQHLSVPGCQAVFTHGHQGGHGMMEMPMLVTSVLAVEQPCQGPAG